MKFIIDDANVAKVKEIWDLYPCDGVTTNPSILAKSGRNPYDVLKELRKIDAQVPIGLIVPHVPADPVALMKEMDALVYLSYLSNMTPEIIEEVQKAGYYVSGSVLKDRHWIEEALKCKVNMFESDNPEKYYR